MSAPINPSPANDQTANQQQIISGAALFTFYRARWKDVAYSTEYTKQMFTSLTTSITVLLLPKW
jgi:hypothetical protein